MNWAAWTLIALGIIGATACHFQDYLLVPILSFAAFIILMLLSVIFEKEEHCMCSVCHPMAAAATVLLIIAIQTGIIYFGAWAWKGGMIP